MDTDTTKSSEKETATLGGGCFWCLEAVYDQLKGVESVASGYMGGQMANPSYEAVCMGRTGHAEVVQISFDPSVVSFSEILEIFFSIHDPTTLNQQGNDVGTQYRSAIFYHSLAQKTAAEKMISTFIKDKVFDSPIVTEVVPAGPFFVAEEYHQEYFVRNPSQPYCTYLINPKLAKFRKRFAEKLKT
jgi:peptide-methionine (S)-S-oxide reductase